MIIGVTGKSGVGKTTYSNTLAKDNHFYVIHIDDFSHDVMECEPIKTELVKIFGNVIIKNDKIDRKYLGDLVFTNRHLYEEISNLIWAETKIKIDSVLQSHKDVILDWILLPHSHYWKMCDRKILIIADENDRKKKVMKRDGISKEYLEKRDSAGISYDEFDFDEIIKNEYK